MLFRIFLLLCSLALTGSVLAARLISLAPSITETLAALGACPWVIAAVGGEGVPQFCPKAAVLLAADGMWSTEALKRYAPDRVLIWTEGTGQSLKGRLETSGMAVASFSIENLQDIPAMTAILANFSGTRSNLPAVDRYWAQQIAKVKEAYQWVPWMPVFYEVWPAPLMTLKQHHYIADALALCHLRLLAPQTSLESPTVSLEWVLQQQPGRVVLPLGLPLQPDWRRAGVQVRQVDTAELERPSPHMLDHLEQICRTIRN